MPPTKRLIVLNAPRMTPPPPPSHAFTRASLEIASDWVRACRVVAARPHIGGWQ